MHPRMRATLPIYSDLLTTSFMHSECCSFTVACDCSSRGYYCKIACFQAIIVDMVTSVADFVLNLNRFNSNFHPLLDY